MASEALEQVSFQWPPVTTVFKAGASLHQRVWASLTVLKIYSFFTLL